MNRPTLLAACVAAACIPAAATVVSVSPGALNAELTDIGIADNRLDISGVIDVRDLLTIASLPVDTISLADTRIKAFSSPMAVHLDRTSFPADEIPDFIFHNAKFKVIALPEGITRIGHGAFLESAIVSIAVPEGVEEIGDIAFRGCADLKSAILPASLKSLGMQAFYADCALEEADLSATAVTRINTQTFADCTSLRSIAMPAALKEIAALAFQGSAISAFSAPAPVDCEPFALADARHLQSADFTVVRPDNATGLFFLDHMMRSSDALSPIPDLAYADAPNIDVHIVIDSPGRIGDYAFRGTAAPGITLTPGVTELGKGVFAGAQNLKYIDVTKLGADIPLADDDSFIGLNCPKIKLYVRHEDKNAWALADGWKNFAISDSYEAVDELIDPRFSIAAADGTLSVSASATIRMINIAATDGRIIAAASPDSYAAKLRFPTPHDGIIIVVTVTDDGVRRDKIILTK